jgi:hypothetical protein
MKIRYKYKGAIWNGNVIYKENVEAYVWASNEREAIVLLERRLKHIYKEISFIKLSSKNLSWRA